MISQVEYPCDQEMEISMKNPEEYRFYAVCCAILSAACFVFGLFRSMSIVFDFMILMESVRQGIELTDDSPRFPMWVATFSFIASIGTYGGYINYKMKHQEAVAQKYLSPESDTKS
jgi:hypothetical protein